MSLFDKIFGKKKPIQTEGDFKALTAYAPYFSPWNGEIYENELVRAAIHAKATNISKLKVEFSGRGAQYLEKRLARPNQFQTWSQFMYRLSTIYDNCNTAFIVPSFDSMGRVVELWPVLPSHAKMVQVQGEPWIAFEFNGKYAQLPVWQVGMMTKFQYRNEFFGETNKALVPTMALIDIQNQGISEGIKSAATYRFFAQYNNVAFADDIKNEQKRFNEQVGSDGGMALLFPKNYENIQQINSKPFVVDANQMEQIRKNVFDYFGVNEDVLQGKAYGDAWTAFYECSIEPFAIQFSEVMTALLILCGDLSGDAKVMATANRLAYLSTNEKLAVSRDMLDRGIFNRDTVCEIWNMPPIPDGQGQAYIIRGEYKNASEHIDEGEEENAGET